MTTKKTIGSKNTTTVVKTTKTTTTKTATPSGAKGTGAAVAAIQDSKEPGAQKGGAAVAHAAATPLPAPVPPVVSITTSKADGFEPINVPDEEGKTLSQSDSTPVVPVSKRAGGLTKEQRKAKTQEMNVIRAKLAAELTDKMETKSITAQEFAKAMMELEPQVEAEYRKAHPKPSKTSGDSLLRTKNSARYQIGKFIRRNPELTKEQVKEFFLFALDNPLFAKERLDLKGKSKSV